MRGYFIVQFFILPVLLLAGYARQKQAAAISAAFIFVNSLSGFAGWLDAGDTNLPWMLLLATPGGLAGARRYTPSTFKWVLATVLLVASGRLLVGYGEEIHFGKRARK